MTFDDKAVVICRACLGECQEYSSLFKTSHLMGEMTSLAQILSECTNLKFQSDEDFLPQHICRSCEHNLTESYAFRKLVLEADEMLRKDHAERSNKIDGMGCESRGAELLRDLNDMQYVAITVLGNTDEKQPSRNRQDEVVLLKAIERHAEQDVCDRVKDDVVHMEFEADPTQVLYQSVDSLDDVSNNTCDVVATNIENRTSSKLSAGTGVVCKICGRSFTKSYSLRSHMRLHAIGSEFSCRTCGKSCGNHSNLLQHMLTHSGEKPYSCNNCGRAFTTSGNANRHRRLYCTQNKTVESSKKGSTNKMQQIPKQLTFQKHDRDRSCECKACGAMLSCPGNLKRHMKAHLRAKAAHLNLVFQNNSKNLQMQL